jgi:hypothetical protein
MSQHKPKPQAMNSNNDKRRRLVRISEEVNQHLWEAAQLIDSAAPDLEALEYQKDRFQIIRNMLTSIRQKLWDFDRMTSKFIKQNK